MNILVAGGAGFIGINFIKYWSRKYPKDSLYVLDNFSVNTRDIFERSIQSTRVTLFETDARNGADVQSVFEQVAPNIVLNLIDGTRSPEFLQSNIFCTINLLQSSKAVGVTHFVHISPSDVYGLNSSNRAEALRLLHEADAMLAYSPQQASKAAADMFVQSYWHAYRLPVTVLRMDYVYGPYQSPDRLIPLMIVHALQNRPIPIHIAPSSEQSVLHISDTFSLFDTILSSDQSKGKTFNVSAGVHVSVIELAESILTVLGRSKSLIELDPQADARQLGMLDTTLVRKELNWEPKNSRDLYKRIEETIQWYQENKEWWERDK